MYMKSADLLQVGRSADLKVGQSVFSIGSPYGFSKTFTAGVVSGLNRGVPSPVGTIVTGAVQVSESLKLLDDEQQKSAMRLLLVTHLVKITCPSISLKMQSM